MIELLQMGKPANDQAMRIMLALEKDLPRMLRQTVARALSFAAVGDRAIDRLRPVDR
jgi:hypothetical protein